LGSIWTLTYHQLIRIDPSSARVIERIEIPPGRYDTLTVAFHAVWLVGQVTGKLLRVDPETATVRRERHTDSAATGPIASDAVSVWMASSSEGGGMIRFGPTSEQGRTLMRGYFPGDFMLHAFGGMYVTTGRTLAVLTTRQHPNPGVFEKLHYETVANAPIMSLTAGLGVLWVNAGRLVSINPRTGMPLHSFAGVTPWTKAEHPPTAGIGVLGQRVWMVDPFKQSVVGVRVPTGG